MSQTEHFRPVCATPKVGTGGVYAFSFHCKRERIQFFLWGAEVSNLLKHKKIIARYYQDVIVYCHEFLGGKGNCPYKDGNLHLR